MPPAHPQIQVLRPRNFELPWLVHGFSTRPGGFSQAYGGGALNLGFTTEDDRAIVERNRAAFLHALGANHNGRLWPIAALRQVHSDVVHRVEQAPREPLVGDGVITRTPGLLLVVKTADCLPILAVDPQQRVVGAFHAGWRGTVKRIAEKGVGEMQRHFSSDPAELVIAIGPGIRRCCYTVGDEVREQFASQFAYADALFEEHQADSDVVHERYPLLFLTARAPGHSELPKKITLDLVEANRRQLVDAGVPPKNICVLDACTHCSTDRFFSYRKEGPTGRMMGAVGISQF